MIINYFKTNEINDSLLTFALIISKFKDKWILCTHRDRETWEFPAGTREPNESIDATASRELSEETGAIEYTIERRFIFEANNIYGMVYYANIIKLGPLPNSEIKKIDLFDNLDVKWTYPDIQPLLIPYLVSLE